MNDEEKTISQVLPSEEFIKYRFIKEYVATGIAWKAYKNIKPDVTEHSARTLSSKLLAKIDMSEVLEELGMGPTALSMEVINGIKNATKPVVIKTKKYETTEDGKKVEVTELEHRMAPDWSTRQRYTDTATKIAKMVGPESVTQNNTTNNIKEVKVVNYGDQKTEDIPQTVVGQTAEE